jgi:hypothetical protein
MVSYPSSSLEDCLTNVVSWTEFTGINWISLISPTPVENANDCPILKAYNECQKLRLYSFWRRRPGPTQTIANKHVSKSPTITGKEAKELWIFWYDATEPEIIKEFLSNGLIQDQAGSFANNGLDYKIRILLYDGLHRILESGCLAKNYIRFGRWFCQPLTELISTRKKILPKYMIAFQFTFCTFGNQVCISPRFQRQPTLLSITKKHLLQKFQQKVILAPWGLVGHILLEQSHFDLNNPEPPEAEAEKPSEEKTNLLSSFGGLYSTPEKDKTATKKQLDEILKKYYDDFLYSVGYSELPNLPSGLPNLVAVEIDGISTYWPTALMAICIDDVKDDETDEEEDGSDIEIVDPPSNSPSSRYAGCRVAPRFFEDGLLPPPDRHDERLSLMDATQKELCACKACNVSEAPFDGLPSISPSGILNPNTPHSVQTKISEPPSVPPTSIESVHSTSGDLKHLRRPPRLRYKQPQFSFQPDSQKDRPKSPKIEAEVEEARRNETSWAHTNAIGEYPINHMGSNGGYTVALPDDIWHILPIFRGDQEWDETQAIQRPPSPYTPINVVTPEYSQANT